MKRRKIANYLKIGILFLGFSVLLWNCEKDNNNKSIVENTFKKKYDIISISANEVEGLTSYLKKS